MKSEVKRQNSMDLYMAALGDVLRECRKHLGLTQEAMAHRLELHRNYISLIERGRQNITLETLFKLADVLAIRPSVLLHKVENAWKSDPADPGATPPPFLSPKRRKRGKDSHGG